MTDDDEEEVEFGLTHEFWVGQLDAAEQCLLRYAGRIRRAGIGVVVRGRERVVEKMKKIRANEPLGPTNFVIWSSRRRNRLCSFYGIISRDVHAQ